MIRKLLWFLTVGAFYAALSTYLLVPIEVAAQSPPQGPPPATPNARVVLSNNLTGVLRDTIQPAIDAENAALLNDPNFHAVISVSLIVSPPFMGQTTNFDQPNQFFADVPYSIIYSVTNISVQVGGSWIPYPQTAIIGQDLNLQATCDGWFTGRGALTYSVVPSPAAYFGDTNFPNPQVGILLQQIIPNFVNTVVKAKFAAYGTGPEGELVDSGAACRSLGTPQPIIFIAHQAQDSIQPQDTGSPDILFDPPPSPITIGQDTVTVKVTRIHRLELDGVDGQPAYSAVETPILDFFAGFTHLHIKLPAMIEGQTFIPTSDNVATTLVPVESGTLVLLGVMTYEGIPHEDMAFLTFSRNLDFGAGKQTLYTPKQILLRGIAATTAPVPPGAAYEITVEITAPPVLIGAQ
jgi:hypothetical protein